MTAKRFQEKVVLISGASSGIGAAVARRFADEGAHLALFAHPRDESDLRTVRDQLVTQGIQVLVLTGDVSVAADVDAVVKETLARYDHIDVLISNAGYGYFEHFLKISEERWDRIIAVNLKGAFLLGQRVARVMKQGAVIVYTTSTNAILGDECMCSYNAAKAAVISLTRTMALDLAPLGIRVVAVAPGMVRTRLAKGMLENAELWAKYKTRIPMDRIAETDEIAGLYAFVASEDASYITGECIVVDGGLTAGIRWHNWMSGDWQTIQKTI